MTRDLRVKYDDALLRTMLGRFAEVQFHLMVGADVV